jgi:hypothetical protein
MASDLSRAEPRSKSDDVAAAAPEPVARRLRLVEPIPPHPVPGAPVVEPVPSGPRRCVLQPQPLTSLDEYRGGGGLLGLERGT